jgi:hypothetical protein
LRGGCFGLHVVTRQEWKISIVSVADNLHHIPAKGYITNSHAIRRYQHLYGGEPTIHVTVNDISHIAYLASSALTFL